MGLREAHLAERGKAELRILTAAADEAAAASATKLAIARAEAAAAEKLHGEEMQRSAQAAAETQQRQAVALENAQNDVVRLKVEIERKEDQYADDLQKWVESANASHTKQLQAAVKEAVTACEKKHERQAAVAAQRIRDLEAQVAALQVAASSTSPRSSRGSSSLRVAPEVVQVI